jgi:hypothetical protein
MGDTKPKHFFVLGIGVGVSLCVVLFSVAMAIQNLETLKADVWNWQTLIAGLLAVAAAVATIFSLEKQIAETRAQQEDQRERREYADRAAMPAALAILVRYGDENLKILVSLRSGLTMAGNIRFPATWTAPSLPDYPSDAAETLRTCLVNTGRDKREPIAQILRDLQRLHSRLRSIVENVSDGSTMSVSMSNLSDYILGALDFLVRCNNTIPYARRDGPSPPTRPSLEEISTKAFFKDIHKEDFPFVHEAIECRYTDPT